MTKQDIAVSTEAPLAETVGDIMLNPPLLQQIDSMATRMATAKATIPAHLKGNEGDCWAVIMQAVQWKMNPYVVAQKTHVVNGHLGYEAQLVNAVIQSSGMSGRFHYEYEGDGEGMSCRVGAIINGETDITWGEWLTLSDVKVRNSPLWKTNPKQQLGYLQVKNWARAYTPGAILGVYTRDELQEIPAGEREVGPAVSDINAAVKAKPAPVPREVEADVIDTPVEPEPAREPVAAHESAEKHEEEPLTFAMVAEAIHNMEGTDHATRQFAAQEAARFCGIEGNEKYQEELMDLFKARLKALKVVEDQDATKQ